MAFREVRVIEVREVLRAWLAGAGLRTVGERAVWVPKTSSVGCDLHLLHPTEDRRTGHARIVRRASATVLPRTSYLALTGVVTLPRLLPMSNTDKDIEILVPRH